MNKILINRDKILYDIEKVDKNMDNLEISLALENIFELLRSCNKYIDDTTPWILAKDESKKDRLAHIPIVIAKYL